MDQKDIDRFWQKVDKERSTIFYNGTRCWEWIAGCFSDGYGQFWTGQRIVKAHRLAYEFANGEIPNGLLVLHHCDNRICVNASHLFPGTHQENTIDMIQKGRQAHGESHGQSKLTIEHVKQIRERYAEGGTSQKQLAKDFGIGRRQVSSIINFEYWKE